jgi:hypothetical protein
MRLFNFVKYNDDDDLLVRYRVISLAVRVGHIFFSFLYDNTNEDDVVIGGHIQSVGFDAQLS